MILWRLICILPVIQANPPAAVLNIIKTTAKITSKIVTKIKKNPPKIRIRSWDEHINAAVQSESFFDKMLKFFGIKGTEL